MSLTELEYIDLPGEVPAASVLAPGQAIRLQSSSARFDGSAAAAAFLPCLALYSQDGKLIGRWPAAQTLSPGDTGGVTWGPFLGRETQAAADVTSPTMPGAQTFTPWAIYGAQVSNNAAIFQDSAVINGGYVGVHSAWNPNEADPTPGGPAYPAYIQVPVWLGKADGVGGRPLPASPLYGGYWGHFIMRRGPDAPQIEVRAASAMVDGTLRPPYSADLTWETIFDDDLYDPVSQWDFFGFYLIIEGADGDIFTNYGGVNNGDMNGGPGMYHFAIFRTGKNAASTGYDLDVSEIAFSGVAL